MTNKPRVRCGYCDTVPGAPGWEAHATYLWANQHGYKKRVFCNRCGAWTDVVDWNWDKKPYSTVIIKPPTTPNVSKAT